MVKKKGLGRGFDTLIPDDLFDESFDPTKKEDDSVSQLRTLKLEEVQVDPDQPRKHFDDDALSQLTASVKEHGILQPIVVTKKGDTYQIIAGERRYRASKAAKLSTIPALVRSVDGQQQLELALIENIQRHDLNPMETATAYAKMREQFNMSLEEIAKRVGKSVSSVSNTMRLLKLSLPAQHALMNRNITEGQARPLVNLSDDEVAELLPVMIKEGWSARKVEQVVSSVKQPRATTTESSSRDEHRLFQEALMNRLGTGVSVKSSKNGKGSITISFDTSEHLAQLKDQLLPLNESNLTSWQ